jgi:hypothetical protein
MLTKHVRIFGGGLPRKCQCDVINVEDLRAHPQMVGNVHNSITHLKGCQTLKN